MTKKNAIKMNLQYFANNQNQAIKTYQPQFKEMLQAVVESQAYFRDLFVGGTIEALDGVEHNKKAFSLKVSDIPVVLGGEYNKNPNVGMGTGTANSSRFGEITEITYTDEDVEYDWEWVYHEGIDRATVNYDFNEAVAERLGLQAEAKVNEFTDNHASFISENAAESFGIGEVNKDSVVKLFNDMRAHFTNKRVKGSLVRTAKVSPEIYNIIVDHPLTTGGKKSGANIDEGTIYRFKGFEIEEIPEDLLQEGDLVYAYAKGIAKAFTGINTVRTVEATDFDGVHLQGHGKAGEYIPNQNKVAIVKAVKEEVPAG